MALNPIRPATLARLLLVEAVPPIAPIVDPAREPLDFSAGQRFQARVDARLPNGNFKVHVYGQALQMNLPESARPGDRMELVLLAREPRLKFLLLGDGQSKTSADAALSVTGRFLGALALDLAKSLAAPAAANATPVLAGPPADGRQLPALLQEALSESGLFYESHQAQWVTGKRTLGQLLQEPQGRLSAAASPQLDSVSAAPQPTINSEIETAVADAAHNTDAPVHAQTLTLVQQQLSALETGQVSWRGEIWPGQWLEWDIAEHPPRADAADEPARWLTRLRLTLPKLGEVTAAVGIDFRGVRFALNAAAAETAELLESNQRPLATALAVAGLSVVAMEVRHDAGR